MTSGNVDVRIHDTDEVTWATLEKAFPVKRAGAEGSTTWIEVVDVETGIRLTFFKLKDAVVECAEDEAPYPDHFEGNLGANIAGGYEPIEDATHGATRTYLTARFDVTDLTVQERGNLALAVSVQAERNKDHVDDGGYPDVDLETFWDDVEEDDEGMPTDKTRREVNA